MQNCNESGTWLVSLIYLQYILLTICFNVTDYKATVVTIGFSSKKAFSWEGRSREGKRPVYNGKKFCGLKHFCTYLK